MVDPLLQIISQGITGLDEQSNYLREIGMSEDSIRKIEARGDISLARYLLDAKGRGASVNQIRNALGLPMFVREREISS